MRSATRLRFHMCVQGNWHHIFVFVLSWLTWGRFHFHLLQFCELSKVLLTVFKFLVKFFTDNLFHKLALKTVQNKSDQKRRLLFLLFVMFLFVLFFDVIFFRPFTSPFNWIWIFYLDRIIRRSHLVNYLSKRLCNKTIVFVRTVCFSFFKSNEISEDSYIGVGDFF